MKNIERIWGKEFGEIITWRGFLSYRFWDFLAHASLVRSVYAVSVIFLDTVFFEGSKVALGETDEILFSLLVILNVALCEQNYDLYCYLGFP